MAKTKKTRKQKYPNLKSLRRFYSEYKSKIFGFILFTAVASGLALSFPYVSSNIILNLTEKKWGDMVIYAVVLFGLIALENFAGHLSDVYYTKTTNGLFFNFRKHLAYKIIDLRLSSIYDKGSGFYLERLNEDSREASVVFLDISKAIVTLIVNLAFIFYISVLNWVLGLIFLAGLCVIIFLEYLRVSKLLFNKKQGKRAVEKVKALESELLKGIKEVKGLNAKDAIVEKHSNVSKGHIDIKIRRERYEKRMQRIIDVTKGALDFTLLLVAGLLLLPSIGIWHVEIIAVLVIYQYKGSIYELVAGLARIKNHYVNGELAAKRLNDVLKAETEDTDLFGTEELEESVEKIEFKKVVFSYNEKTPVLRDISFSVNKNTLVGFVGKSGSGKSTIFSLLTNFYKISKGQILINGKDFYSLSEKTVRNTITPVLQDPYIFNDTILNNVKFAKQGAADEDVFKACRLAMLHEEILAMKGGYDTIVGESGANLSGGQKQRLEIARVILKDPEVVLFDEATSALDKDNLLQINALMKELKKNKTVFVIAHRLGIMRECDTVFVLDQGVIIASGKHEDLMQTCDYYKDLFKRNRVTEEQAKTGV
ncbi:MAG: ABC transporter ATP-binding protein/permease [Firmicutes bacterium]|nr:ABC transporter ATP-binding protein/permease [Bacillota bacterium]